MDLRKVKLPVTDNGIRYQPLALNAEGCYSVPEVLEVLNYPKIITVPRFTAKYVVHSVFNYKECKCFHLVHIRGNMGIGKLDVWGCDTDADVQELIRKIELFRDIFGEHISPEQLAGMCIT